MTHGPFYHVTQNEKEMCPTCHQQEFAGPPGFQHIDTAPKGALVRLRFRPGLGREDREEIGIWLAQAEMPSGGAWFDEEGNYITPGPLFWAPYVREGYTFYTSYRP